MDQERWRRVKVLFHAALERGPKERQAFLDVKKAEAWLYSVLTADRDHISS